MPPAAIPVGELTVTRVSSDVFRARAEFRVPDVPAGLYRIEYCNDPCTVRWLGDLVGSESFAIGATRTEGRLLLRAERLRYRIQEVAYRTRRQATEEIRDYKRDLRAAASREATAESRLRELTERLRTTRSELEAERSDAATTSVIAGGLLLAALVLLVLLLVTIKRLRGTRVDAELQAMMHTDATTGPAASRRPRPLH